MWDAAPRAASDEGQQPRLERWQQPAGTVRVRTAQGAGAALLSPTHCARTDSGSAWPSAALKMMWNRRGGAADGPAACGGYTSQAPHGAVSASRLKDRSGAARHDAAHLFVICVVTSVVPTWLGGRRAVHTARPLASPGVCHPLFA